MAEEWVVSKRRPWIRIFVDDFDASVLALSEETIGVYMKFVTAYWRNGGPLPANIDYLSSTLRVGKPKLARALRELLGPDFDKIEGKIPTRGQARACKLHAFCMQVACILQVTDKQVACDWIDKQLAQATEKSDKAAQSAKARWDANADAVAMPDPVPDPITTHVHADARTDEDKPADVVPLDTVPTAAGQWKVILCDHGFPPNRGKVVELARMYQRWVEAQLTLGEFLEAKEAAEARTDSIRSPLFFDGFVADVIALRGKGGGNAQGERTTGGGKPSQREMPWLDTQTAAGLLALRKIQ